MTKLTADQQAENLDRSRDEILDRLHKYLSDERGWTPRDIEINRVLREFHSIGYQICLWIPDQWEEYSGLWFDALNCAIEQVENRYPDESKSKYPR